LDDSVQIVSGVVFYAILCFYSAFSSFLVIFVSKFLTLHLSPMGGKNEVFSYVQNFLDFLILCFRVLNILVFDAFKHAELLAFIILCIS
jgi:hypothetical protein